MKFFVFCLCIICTLSDDLKKEKKYRTVSTTIQSPDDSGWVLKYHENTEFWQSKSPIFLFIGAGKINNVEPLRFLHEGLMYELAQEMSAAMFYAAHRYYDNTTEELDLKYLNTAQALEDVYYILRTIKEDDKYKDAKVVLFGGHYGGSLAVWMKVKHPEEVHAVLASSAPLVAIIDFCDYHHHVLKMFEEQIAGPCKKALDTMFFKFENLLEKGKLHSLEDSCPEVDMSNEENQQFFYYVKALLLASGVLTHVADMYSTCGDMIKAHDIVPALEEHPCFSYDFENFMGRVKTIKKLRSLKYWLYQSCTELGYFATTSATAEPLTKKIPLDFYKRKCSLLFGPKFNEEKLKEGVKNINELYGGRSPDVTNVIFSQGALDPWQHVGVDSSVILGNNNAFIYVHNESHCRDLFPVGRHSSRSLINAREEEKTLLKKWLGTPFKEFETK